ncbi:delta-like protein 1 [Octopus bimaculoides]|uniref:Delta-like protein n=1 Tax=Octopus bimaculoides TaxID=37653 RepID=A0A0L8HS87_OCTBM|nr:delta-like protein 1 [Octopus bimaculoides]|eukprot:XP_014769856.1 PREDICTED: delta-like protein 1 [Octopus bimaculoides]
MRSTTALLWASILVLITLKQVLGTGMFQIHLKSFRNTKGLLKSGNCCSNNVVATGQAGNNCTACSTFFRICLTHYMANIVSGKKCSFALTESPVLGSNVIDFSQDLPNFTNPLKFLIKSSWPRSFSLIIEAWHKIRNGQAHESPHRQLISSVAISEALDVSSNWRPFSYIEQPVEFSFNYRFICNENYYGLRCNTVCRPRDDKFGHYKCTREGQRKCLPGWKGDYCDQPICLAGCHPLQGFCNQPNKCKCRAGWNGKYCNECAVHPTCHKGTCQKPWDCNCIEGWGGLLCNEDLNYCTHHSPCKNQGTCTNTGQGSYTCNCPEGFNGTNCEIRVDNCDDQSCLNFGVCERIGVESRCRCPNGFGGKYCEIKARNCAGHPCRNGGRCVNNDDGYLCECVPGYSGHNCEVEIIECSSNPCQNKGRCVDDVNGFHCVCEPGYSGKICEVNEDDCLKKPCLNGGTCEDKINDFECHCKPGYAGYFCESQLNDCVIQPCKNGGTCIDLINDFRCICPLEYTGKDCTLNITKNIAKCASNPCKNGSTCIDHGSSYLCTCLTGFSGVHCDHHEGTTNYSAFEDQTESVDKPEGSLSVLELGLSICLGAGLPLIVIITVVIIMLLRHQRHHFRENMQKETEQNRINSKCMETDIFMTNPSASSSDKFTKELECSNRFHSEQFYHEKSTNILRQNVTGEPHHKPYNKKMLTPISNIGVGECKIKVDIEKPTNRDITGALLKNERAQRHSKNNLDYQHVSATEV